MRRAWGEHADFTDARGAAITAKLLELAALQPGERVLEADAPQRVDCGFALSILARQVDTVTAGERSTITPESTPVTTAM